MNGKVNRWIIGGLVVIGIALGGFFAGRLNQLDTRMDTHAAQMEHPGSAIKFDDIERRLQRIENNQEKILDELRKGGR